jgi:hypothetical protein
MWGSGRLSEGAGTGKPRQNPPKTRGLVVHWVVQSRPRDGEARHAPFPAPLPPGVPRLAGTMTPAVLAQALAAHPGTRNTWRRVRSHWSRFFGHLSTVHRVFDMDPMHAVERPAERRPPIAFYELDTVERIVGAQPTLSAGPCSRCSTGRGSSAAPRSSSPGPTCGKERRKCEQRGPRRIPAIGWLRCPAARGPSPGSTSGRSYRRPRSSLGTGWVALAPGDLRGPTPAGEAQGARRPAPLGGAGPAGGDAGGSGPAAVGARDGESDAGALRRVPADGGPRHHWRERVASHEAKRRNAQV